MFNKITYYFGRIFINNEKKFNSSSYSKKLHFSKKKELTSHTELTRKYNILLFFLFGGTSDKIPFFPNLSVSLSSSSFLNVKHLKQQPEANKAKVKIHQRPIARTNVDG